MGDKSSIDALKITGAGVNFRELLEMPESHILASTSTMCVFEVVTSEVVRSAQEYEDANIWGSVRVFESNECFEYVRLRVGVKPSKGKILEGSVSAMCL